MDLILGIIWILFIAIMSYPKVTIIILNWNGWVDTINCLNSLREISYNNYNIILLDNGSEDDSINKIFEYLRANYDNNFNVAHISGDSIPKSTRDKTSSHKITFLTNDNNDGFAQGNNLAISHALIIDHPEYILLLNNDTTVDKKFLSELIIAAENNPELGSLQPILLTPDGEKIDSLGHELMTWNITDKDMNDDYSKFKKSSPSNVEIFGPCNAAVLYRRNALLKTGLFDKDFFAIYEDVDLAWKIRLSGYKSLLVVNAIVYHKRGISGQGISVNNNIHIKKFHSSKNWLAILIRYYPLSILIRLFLISPHRFCLYKYRALSYGARTRNLSLLMKILKNSLKIRKEIQHNPLLHKLQQRWIMMGNTSNFNA